MVSLSFHGRSRWATAKLPGAQGQVRGPSLPFSCPPPQRRPWSAVAAVIPSTSHLLALPRQPTAAAGAYEERKNEEEHYPCSILQLQRKKAQPLPLLPSFSLVHSFHSVAPLHSGFWTLQTGLLYSYFFYFFYFFFDEDEA